MTKHYKTGFKSIIWIWGLFFSLAFKISYLIPFVILLFSSTITLTAFFLILRAKNYSPFRNVVSRFIFFLKALNAPFTFRAGVEAAGDLIDFI